MAVVHSSKKSTLNQGLLHCSLPCSGSTGGEPGGGSGPGAPGDRSQGRRTLPSLTPPPLPSPPLLMSSHLHGAPGNLTILSGEVHEVNEL